MVVWSFAQKTEIDALNVKTDNATACSIALTTDNQVVACGFSNGTIRVWNLKEKHLQGELKGHYACVNIIAIPSNNKYIISGSIYDRTVRVWDLDQDLKNKAIIVLKDSSYICCVAVTANSRYVAYASIFKCVRVWDLEKKEYVDMGSERHRVSIETLAVSSDSRYAVSGSFDGAVRLWGIEQKEGEFTMPGHNQSVSSIEISNDCKYIVSASYDRSVRIWNTQDKIQEAVIYYSEHFVKCVAITKDNRYILLGSSNGVIEIWEKNELRLEALLRKGKDFNSLALTSANTYIVFGFSNKTVRVWKTAKCKGCTSMIISRDELK